MLTFDTVISKYIKPIGRWQWFTFIVVNLTIFGIHSSFPALASLTPDHFCAIPDLAEAGLSDAEIRRIAIPLHSQAKATNRSSNEDYDSCHQFLVHNISNYSFDIPDGNRFNDSLILRKVVPCQNGWHYMRTTAQFRWSFPEEFNLVCHRKYIVPLTNSVYFIGSILGRVFGGYLGDRFGRKPVIIASCGLTCLLGFGIAFAPNEWVFCALRLCLGAVSNAAVITSIVLWSEMTDDRHRNTLGFLFGLHSSFLVPSCTILAAYITQNWSYMHLCMTILYGLCIFHPCLISESPRWLLTKGRVNEACRIIRRAMRCNGQLNQFSKETLSNLETDLQLSYAAVSRKKKKAQRTFTSSKLASLLTSPDLRRRILPFLFIWTVIMGTSFGLQYYSVRMKHSNPYLVAFVGSTFTVPGLIMKQFLYHFFDRKRPLVGVFAASATICTIGAVLRSCAIEGPWDGALATIALGCILVAQNMCYTYTAECFPTEYRSYAMGLVSGLGRIGAAFSSFVERLDEYVWSGLPLTIFAAMSAGAALTVCVVPHAAVEMHEIHIHMEAVDGKREEENEDEEEELEAIEVLGRSFISLHSFKETRTEKSPRKSNDRLMV